MCKKWSICKRKGFYPQKSQINVKVFPALTNVPIFGNVFLTSYFIYDIFSEPSYKNCAPTGEQLSDQDLQFLVKKTRFNKKIILSWFRNFRSECPNGKLSRSHLYGDGEQAIVLLQCQAHKLIQNEGYPRIPNSIPMQIGIIGLWDFKSSNRDSQ